MSELTSPPRGRPPPKTGAGSPDLEAYDDARAWALLDAAPDATIVVAASGDIVFANDQATRLFGHRAEDLIGRPVEILVPEGVGPRHRAHRTRFRAAPEARPMGGGLDLRARCADGSDLPVEISLSPLRLGDDTFVIAAVRDISARVATEDHLRRIVHTLDSTIDAVFIFDAATLQYSFVNEGAVRLLGYDRHELLTMTPLHLNPHTTEAQYRRDVAALVAEPSSATIREATLLARDGHEVRVEKTFRAAPTARDGSSWVIVLARDISARLAAEERLRASEAARRAAELEAERHRVLHQERDRMAGDLHDTIIKRIYRAGLDLQSAAARTHDDAARDHLLRAVDGLDTTLGALRSVVFALQSQDDTARTDALADVLGAIDEGTDALGVVPTFQLNGPVDHLGQAVTDELAAVVRRVLAAAALSAPDAVHVTVRVGDDVTATFSIGAARRPGPPLSEALADLCPGAPDAGGRLTIEEGSDGSAALTWTAATEAEADIRGPDDGRDQPADDDAPPGPS